MVDVPQGGPPHSYFTPAQLQAAQEASQYYGLPLAGMLALLWRESGAFRTDPATGQQIGFLDPNARGAPGIVGIAQLAQSTANNLYHPLTGERINPRNDISSIWGAAQYVARLATGGHDTAWGNRTFDIEAGFLGYNTTPTIANRWRDSGRNNSVLPAETREYHRQLANSGVFPQWTQDLQPHWWNAPESRNWDPSTLGLQGDLSRLSAPQTAQPWHVQDWSNYDWGKAFSVDPDVGARAQLQGLMPLNLDINNQTGVWERVGNAEGVPWTPIYNAPGNLDLDPYQPGMVSNALGGYLAYHGGMPHNLGYDPATDAWQNPTTIPNWAPQWSQQSNQLFGDQRNQQINAMLANAQTLGAPFDPSWAGLDWATGAVGQGAGAALQAHGYMPYNMTFEQASNTWTHPDLWNPQYLMQGDLDLWATSPNAATNWGPNQGGNAGIDYTGFFNAFGAPSAQGLSPTGGPAPGVATAGVDLAHWFAQRFGGGPGSPITTWDATPDMQIWNATPGSNVNVIDAPLEGPTLRDLKVWDASPWSYSDLTSAAGLNWALPGQISQPLGATMQFAGLLPLDLSYNPSTTAWDAPSVPNWTPSFAPGPSNPNAPISTAPGGGFSGGWDFTWGSPGAGGTHPADVDLSYLFGGDVGWNMTVIDQSGGSGGTVPYGYGSPIQQQSIVQPQPQTWVQGGQMSIFGIPLAAGYVPSSIVQQIGPGGIPLAPGSATGVFGAA